MKERINMTQWFISDLHLGHKNVIDLNNRPFKSIQQMEEEIVKRWNKKVQQNDVVYVLGDVVWGWNSNQIKDLFTRLNGIKYLIYGNHDRLTPHEKANVWAEIVPYKEINIGHEFVILSHYPIFEWNCFFRKSYHLYGHTHGSLNLAEHTMKRDRPNMNCWDVGVDNNDFEPISWEEVKEKIANNIKNLLTTE